MTKTAFMLTLLLMLLAPVSCDKRELLELDDLLGTWQFTNTVQSGTMGYGMIADQITVTLHADYTLSVPSLGLDHASVFGFDANRFRMVIPYEVSGSHFVLYALWQGEPAGDGRLRGKLYSASPHGDEGIMEFAVSGEFGDFSASRVED